MPNTVFSSWQSDTSARETRDLIRDALSDAINRISASIEEAERPELDQDTKGVPGMPEIVATILDKIDRAAVFVGDVTPVALSESGKQVANPNVLIELGYAKKSLSASRVILVWNTAIFNSRPEDLPFDLRHRRGPISFALPTGADRRELRRVRDQLSAQFVEALNDILASIPAPSSPKPNWFESEGAQPAIWKGNTAGLPVNDGFNGTAEVIIEGGSTGFARLIPAQWEVVPNALSILEHQTQHPIPLGRYGGLNWGPTTGGFLAYRHGPSVEETGVTTTATRWFRISGELWGVDSQFIRDGDEYATYSELYAAERWLAWLKQSAMICRVTGGKPPFRGRLGIEGLRGARWSKSYLGGSVPQALEERVEVIFDLHSDDDAEIREKVLQALNAARDAFGLTSLSKADFENLANTMY